MTGGTKPTNGIAIDGGAMRLPFFGGFLKKLQEENLEVDQMAGISSGALLALGFQAGVSMQEAYETQIEWAFRHRFEFRAYRKYMDAFEYIITPEVLDGLDGRLVTIASKITLTGLRTEIFDSYDHAQDLKDKLAASGSIPFFNDFPARVGGAYYVDGYLTCQNPAMYLTTDLKLSILGIPEYSDIENAARLGDVIVMDSFRGHSAMNTFLFDRDAIRDWFDFGYEKAEGYLADPNRRLFR